MNRFLKFCIAIGAIVAVVGAARVKNETIDTKILELPNVSLETINYNGISIGYALGEIAMEAPEKLTAEMICKPKDKNELMKLNGEYYRIEYSKPDVYIVAKDNAGTVIYAEKITAPYKETALYGKSDCRFWLPGTMEQTFEKEKDQFKAELNSEEIKKARSSVGKIVSRTLFARYEEESFKLMYVDDKNGGYKDLSEAYELALSVYKAYKSNGYSSEVVEPLKKAIEIWKKALTESNLSDRKARINHEITLKLYENIAIAYMFLNDYETAIMNFNKIKSLEKSVTTSSVSHHFSQVRNRAMSRIAGVSLNRSILSIPDKIRTAVADAERFRSQIKVNDMQSQYAEIVRQYTEYKNSEASTTGNFVSDAQQKAIAEGSENPYDNQVSYSLVQGYFFMQTPLMAMGTKYPEVPVQLCEIERLNELLITKNTVARIPPEIGKLKNLKTLNLKDNQITEVPEELSQLASAVTIDLSGNKISKLPASIGQLKKLKTLNLKDNPIAPDEIARIQAALPKCKVKF